MMVPLMCVTTMLALRVVALGRKNFLFAGSESGGERVAAMYSLIGTAKLNGIEREAYLREVLARIADHQVSRTDDHIHISNQVLATENILLQDALARRLRLNTGI